MLSYSSLLVLISMWNCHNLSVRDLCSPVTPLCGNLWPIRVDGARIWLESQPFEIQQHCWLARATVWKGWLRGEVGPVRGPVRDLENGHARLGVSL